jgi:AraC-like DNA-binding protein
LLETRDRLITNLRHDVPSAWSNLIGTFLSRVKDISESLPPGALLLLVADLARELDRLAARTHASAERPPLLAALDLRKASEESADAVCSRFEQAFAYWCVQLEPEPLVTEVQAQRVAAYIDRHFAEPITLERLSEVSGWGGRDLSRAFRSTMQMSIREYLQAARIDHAAARLREGDKVESVLATVGWRGRKNFFRHFKDRIGTTPAQYRDSWKLLPGRTERGGMDRESIPRFHFQ